MTAETERTETLRNRAERELAADVQFRVVCQLGVEPTYQLQKLSARGETIAVRPVQRVMWTLWNEAVRGRVALLERYLQAAEA